MALHELSGKAIKRCVYSFPVLLANILRVIRNNFVRYGISIVFSFAVPDNSFFLITRIIPNTRQTQCIYHISTIITRGSSLLHYFIIDYSVAAEPPVLLK